MSNVLVVYNCLYACVCVCVRVCVNMNIHMLYSMYVYIYIWTCVCVCVFVRNCIWLICVCVSASPLCVCACVCLYPKICQIRRPYLKNHWTFLFVLIRVKYMKCTQEYVTNRETVVLVMDYKWYDNVPFILYVRFSIIAFTLWEVYCVKHDVRVVHYCIVYNV